VIRNDGAPIDAGSSFLRNLLRFADTFFFLFHVALISITASSGFRRLGDWAGGTLVVYSQTSAEFPRSNTGFLAKYNPITAPCRLSYEEKQTILNLARRYSLLGESRVNEIAGICAPYMKNKDTAAFSEITDAAYLLGLARSLSGESFPVSQKVSPEKTA
jgi:hypothetical protein